GEFGGEGYDSGHIIGGKGSGEAKLAGKSVAAAYTPRAVTGALAHHTRSRNHNFLPAALHRVGGNLYRSRSVRTRFLTKLRGGGKDITLATDGRNETGCKTCDTLTRY